MHNRQLVLAEQWLERRKARMQSEKSIEIDCRVSAAAPRLRDRNRWAQPVVVRLPERHYDVQSVRSPALKQDYELFLARRRGRRRDGPLQERGHRAESDHRDSGLL